ncbi:MAG TPA: hypothetical protein VGQ57_21835 [Polyangiaceae bacterium]|jgi:hypothetical protein|nr:hypothetical protein [Polyangiaceae bacterium]
MRSVPTALVAACLLSLSCGSNDSTAVAPPPKVTLRVTALVPVGEDAWHAAPAGETSSPAVVTIGCDRRLGVELTIENYSLRAPNACSGAVQCGYEQVTLLHVEDGSVALGPVLGATSTPLLDLSALEPLAGDYLLRPELLTETGDPFTENYAEPPQDLPVTLVATDCANGGAAGDGAGGAAGDGAGGATGG